MTTSEARHKQTSLFYSWFLRQAGAGLGGKGVPWMTVRCKATDEKYYCVQVWKLHSPLHDPGSIFELIYNVCIFTPEQQI